MLQGRQRRLGGIVAFIACRMAFSQVVVRWPMFLYESYRSSLSHLPPEVVDWLLGHIYVFDPGGNLTRLQILMAMEASYGLPMLLLASVGGLSAVFAGGRSQATARMVEASARS